MVVLVFVVSIFSAAFLVFAVQPLTGRLVLPLLGGSPAVWNTCLVFFQTVLLAGYAYAHFSTRVLGVRHQAMIHAVVVLVPVLLLPIGLPLWAAWGGGVGGVDGGGGGVGGAEGGGVWWLLGVLVVAVGGPVLVISSAGPLMQRWFAASCRRVDGSARDPYPLYAASNAGSLLALVAYPVLIEPTLTLGQQRWWWSAGYGLFALMTVVAAVVVVLRARGAGSEEIVLTPMDVEVGKGSTLGGGVDVGVGEAVGWRRRLMWVGLALVPSALLMSATRFITTDIAPVPLLWVVPLGLYLLTFIGAFAGRGVAERLTRGASMVGPVAFTAVAVAMMLRAAEPVIVVVILHLVVLGIGAMVCHGRLSLSRPAAEELTGFYLWIALGGALGGVLVALVAPVVFSGLIEYPLAVGAAAVWMFARRGKKADGEEVGGMTLRGFGLDVLIACGLCVLVLVLGVVGGGLKPAGVGLLVSVGVPGLLVFLTSRRPVRFGLCVAAAVGPTVFSPHTPGNRVIERERTWFGVHTVELERRMFVDPQTGGDVAVEFHWLAHGTTVHGLQSLEAGLRDVPLAYYHPTGPIGDVFGAVIERASADGRPSGLRVAAVGLGTGAVAAYLRGGDSMTFYEIDPAVVRIAEDDRLFTYLRDARYRGASVGHVLGDARLRLAGSDGADTDRGTYDLIVLDAFSSDAIPIHLLTVEAFEVYLSRLAPGGVLAVHTSNIHLELEPVVAAVANAAGARSWERRDNDVSGELGASGKFVSRWVLVERRAEGVGEWAEMVSTRLPAGRGWLEITPGVVGTDPESGRRVWTDDYSNIWSVFRPMGH